jgi:hypothetical protein
MENAKKSKRFWHLNIHYFDAVNLNYKRLKVVHWRTIFFTLIICGSLFFAGWICANMNVDVKTAKYDEEQKVMIIKTGDKFSEEKLILFLKELNFKWPEIAYSQIRMETGLYNSPICIENLNYFGMKDARGPSGRINTQTGNKSGHAVYQNWRMSVIDYAIYWSTYLSSLKTEEECYNYIESSYSETKGYVEKFRGFEHEYFEKLSKIKAKSSYDIFSLKDEHSVQDGNKIVKK